MANPSAVNQIQHLVVLMFENRSFDHVFGAVPGVNGILGPDEAPVPKYFNLPHPLEPPSETNKPVHLSPVLAELARRERYLALEVSGQRYNIGVKYGLLTAQLALALDGVDREKILAQIVDLLAQRV